MAGKRLLDAAKLFNAGRSIAKQHIALRQKQWDVYSKTSTVAKAVKEQTDRVTVTAGAAYELARRFGENGPPWQPSRSERTTQQSGSQGDSWRASEPARYSEPSARAPDDARQPERNMEWRTTIEDLSEGQAQIREQGDDGSLSSLRKREMQRISENQIPTASADGQGLPERTSTQDSFYARPHNVSPDLSSLPRTKIPKHADQGEGKEEDLSIKRMNYTATEQTAVSTEELPDGAKLDGAFTTPRVSKMFGKPDPNTANPYGGRQKLPAKPLPEMLEAERRRKEQQEEDNVTSSRATNTPESSPEPEVVSKNSDADMESLAESIAQDTTEQPTPADAPQEHYEMRESRVPSSRFGRIWQYGGLATSMAFGAVGESFRRATGGGSSDGSLMLSEGNMNRLVAKLSRMRGAALKLGQMMSFQDSKLLPPTINAVLQRVQDSADYMPASQRDKVLVQNLGQNWRDLFSNFEEKPFAAASIGQVHKATLASNSKDVAVKVQYPGVRNSIDSDLNNLSLLLTASRLLPKGLYLDKTIANARTELAWECDYKREAEACTRFRQLLEEESDIFSVPEIYTEASGPGVLTAEFMHGTAVTKMKDLSQHDRDWVGTQILRLALRELMEWHFMQTDPNWTNFLYNRESQKLELLDFGASRDFPKKFVHPYVALLIAASKGDRETCKDRSIELGYLTGRESKEMLKAHVDSILTLAEPFVESAPEVYDFEDQTITDRVRANIGLMLKERLAPPPEETYSLHRKLSGAFLLCARLRSRIRARDMFARAVEVWNGRNSSI